MQLQANSVRFELIVNGERRCVAGIEEFGVMATTIDWVVRHPSRRPCEQTVEEWSEQRLRYHMGGLIAQEAAKQIDEHVTWDSGDLKVGDEICIRILGPGEFDQPAPNVNDS